MKKFYLIFCLSVFYIDFALGQNVAPPTAPNKKENGKRVGEWVIWK
jgi:hypothetical protein